MPKPWQFACLFVVTASPLACAAPAPAPTPPVAQTAPALPNAALLEFVGDWTEQERELLNMDEKTEQSKQAQAATAKNRREQNDAR